MPIASFENDLAFSLRYSDEPFWLAVFKKAFPKMVYCELCGDIERQRKGIDRIIHLSSGAKIKVDQKLRRKDYSDIALEFVSVDKPIVKPGWIEKDLDIDYLAYAFLESRTCYLFPFAMLRRAWIHYGGRWRDLYGERETKNKTYSTWWTPVPIGVLYSAVNTASIIKV